MLALYIVEKIKAVAWPITLLCLVYFLRADLQSLLRRLTNVKHKGTEVIFANAFTEVREKAQELGRKSEKGQFLKSTKIDSELSTKDQLYRIAQISPKASIIEAWRYCEEKIKRVGLKFSIESTGFSSEKMILRRLMEDKEIDEDFIKLFITLRELRNRATHVQDFVLNQENAEEFVDAIIELNEELERLVKNKPV